MAGLNVRLRETLAKILESGGGDAVIVLEADHGSALGLDPHSAEGTDVAERFGILRAVRVPPWADRDAMSASTSAVNTFRGVLAGVFGVGLAPLEDRAFFSDGDLRLTEVTGRLAEERAPLAGGTPRGQ